MTSAQQRQNLLSLIAQACADAGIKFIGPGAASMQMMGSKTRARQEMEKAGIPVVPGTSRGLESMEQAAISGSGASAKEELVSDDEIDRMIQADVLAAEKQELGKLDQLESEIAKELGVAKQKD